jgi:hypothetical protein
VVRDADGRDVGERGAGDGDGAEDRGDIKLQNPISNFKLDFAI